MAKSCLVQEWLKAGGKIQIEWHATTHLFYADPDEDGPPYNFNVCGTGETPAEALKSLIEDANEQRES